MDKKSTAALIARERRSMGLSPRRLAYRLGVRTRDVLSWERGETVPTLWMLNLLSEVLDISPTELIHGERDMSRTEERMDADKRRRARRLMVESISRFTKWNYISIAFAMVGVFFGTFSNLVMHRAWGGFIISFISVLCGCISEAHAMRMAYRSIDTDSFDTKHVALYKSSVLNRGMLAYSIAALFTGWALPMLIKVGSFDAGLDATDTFLYGAVYGSSFFALGLAACFFLHAGMVRTGFIPLSDSDRRIYFHNWRLMLVTVIAFSLLLGISIWGEVFLTGKDHLLKKTEFHTVEDFKAYMQKDLRYPYDGSRERNMEVFYVDRWGAPISEREALKATLRDRNGNLICTYLDRNRNVFDIETADRHGSPFPITVTTFTAVRDAKEKEVVIHTVFAFLYATEMLAAIIIYLRKRKEHEQ